MTKQKMIRETYRMKHINMMWPELIFDRSRQLEEEWWWVDYSKTSATLLSPWNPVKHISPHPSYPESRFEELYAN